MEMQMRKNIKENNRRKQIHSYGKKAFIRIQFKLEICVYRPKR